MNTSGRMLVATALTVGVLVAQRAPAQMQTPAQVQVEDPDRDPILEPQMQGTVAYVSGGIGDDELLKIRAVQENYNVRLLFAERVPGSGQGIGQYLADIPVKIWDQSGRGILDANARGPYMLISLAPGTYKVTAVYNGSSQLKTLTVPAKGTASTVFYWPGT